MAKNILTESTKSKFKVLENKPKNVLKRIQGVLSDFKSNRNGRIYPRELWENVLNSDYVKEMIESHGLVGELDHPEERLEISLQNVSHVINDMWIEGDQVLGTIDILPTPSGKIVSELIDYGTDIGISSRGAGSVGAGNIVDPDYQFVTFDFVARPSCEAARLNMIVESVQPEIDNNSDDKVNNILNSYKQGLKENDTKGMAGAFNISNSLADDTYMERLKAVRKTLSEDDAEGLDMVLDDIDVNPKTCALEDLEDAVHQSVFKYNEANSFDEYENEEFYGREYNANNIYIAIIKLFGRDADLEKSLGYRPKWLDESEEEPKITAYSIAQFEADRLGGKAYKKDSDSLYGYDIAGFDFDFRNSAYRAEVSLSRLNGISSINQLKEAAMSDQEVYKTVLGWYKDQIEKGNMTLNQCYELLSDKAKVSLNKMVDQSKIKESLINETVNKLIKESIELNKKN